MFILISFYANRLVYKLQTKIVLISKAIKVKLKLKLFLSKYKSNQIDINDHLILFHCENYENNSEDKLSQPS